jgi:hypothetical protein
MPVTQRLVGLPSPCSGCQMRNARLPRSAYPAVTSCCPDARLLSSERNSSPSGCSCLLCLAVPRFLSSAAHFAPSAAVSLTSLSKTFASRRLSPTHSDIYSSIISLRNSWAAREPFILFEPALDMRQGEVAYRRFGRGRRLPLIPAFLRCWLFLQKLGDRIT